MTASQHFNQRTEIPDELDAAFEALIESIRRANAEAEAERIFASQLDEDCDTDDFVDARETNEE